MKSGESTWKSFLRRVLKEYSDAHTDLKCKGSFEFQEVKDTLFPLGALGPIRADSVPMVICPECKAAYTFPGFEEAVSAMIAKELVLTNTLLSKAQIRFLRQHFGFSQEDLAKRIGITDRAEFSKIESEKYPQKMMHPHTQLRMKLVFAKILNVVEVQKVLETAEIDETRVAQVNSRIFSEVEKKQLTR